MSSISDVTRDFLISRLADHLVLFTLAGDAELTDKGRWYRISPGSMMFSRAKVEHCYYPLERSGNWKFLCFHLLPETPWSFIAYGRSYVSEAAFACDGRISHGNLSAPRDDAV